MNNNMEDSGKRQEFESGAVRDSADGKPRHDLQSPYAQERIGHWLRLGAEKYDERNWEAGMCFSRCVASIERHLVAFKMGKRDEDHLAAIAVNAQFLMHYEEMIVAGKLPHTLDDMPHYTDKPHKLRKTMPFDELVEELELDEPQFKAGDKVRIKLRERSGTSINARCNRVGNIGTYMGKYAGPGVDSDLHSVNIDDGFVPAFNTDELTLMENN